jgi:predicted CXXCH cytochrome family protein
MHRLPSYRPVMLHRTIFLFFAVFELFTAAAFAQQSPHGPLSIPCTDCHTTDSWKELAQPMKFNHSTTAFALEGQHAQTACIQCHTANKFSGTRSTCFSCHQRDYSRTLLPNHQLGKFSTDCAACHTLNGWKPSTFQHSKTNFQLTGAHQSVDCGACHVNNVFAGLSHDCFSCHQNDFLSAALPKHSTAQFSHDCQSCHTMESWTPAFFDHSKTNFQLIGAHRSAECSSCHTGGKFKGIAADCYACHQQAYVQTTTPNHSKAQFSRDCNSCHTSNGWKPSTFDHSKTNFQLIGVHRTAECSSCHLNGQFKGTATDCYTCHLKDYTIAKPNHVSSQLDHNCTSCHTQSLWKPSIFDHSKTNFPLTGAHITAECSGCHGNGIFKNTPTDCFVCHVKDYSSAKPNHLQAQFDHTCTMCHSTSAWQPSTFDHAKTNFPLLGMHQTIVCASCHVNGKFKGTATDCYSCHQQDFAGTAAPNHLLAQFSHDCSSCHTQTSWQPSTFDHAKTIFPLFGMHKTIECASCHINGKFKGTATDCYTCHQQDFAGTKNPNHLLAQFTHDCSSCHTQTAWRPSTFDHNKTNFPLTGAHLTTDCLFCHKNGQFTGTPSACFSCHSSDYTGVADPNHVLGNFDHNCFSCHTTTVWSPATFDHNKTNFKLTGAHLQAQCAQCHTGGKFAGTTMECYPCHQQAYTQAVNPNHVSAKYPTVCQTCHTTVAWKPSTFDHTPNFPINSSAVHRPGRWSFCSDCHTNPSNAKVFSCIDCHTHNKTSTDNEHNNRTGYSYESAACYRCHPTGRG